MGKFTVLTDGDVQGLLRGSGPVELSRFADVLAQTFQRYSTTDEAEYQPHRVSVKREKTTGQTSLFMPSTSPDNIGVKIVGAPPPQSTSALEATMTICDATAKPVGVLNAAELTAFRTSLGAMLLFRLRKRVGHVVMFGAGKQAYWHLRLALILRGAEIKTITVVNRSRSRADEMVQSLKRIGMTTETGGRQEGEKSIIAKHDINVTVLTPDDTDQVKSAVQKADSIHCTVPSTSPLFPSSWMFHSSSSSQKNEDIGNVSAGGVYMTAIGSYRLDMQELDPDLLRRIAIVDTTINNTSVKSPTTKLPTKTTPKIIVDSRAACFQEAGEIVAAELDGDTQLFEIGEFSSSLLLTTSSTEEEENDDSSMTTNTEEEKKMTKEWLENDTVIYKSVGIGVMDLCIARELLRVAGERGIGVTIENF